MGDAGARLSIPEQRRSARHKVDCALVAEHLGVGEIDAHISNISAHGLMIDNARAIERGDRVMFSLPHIGQIEAYCIWTTDSRAGFQFERIIRPEELTAMLKEMQRKPPLRPR